MKKGLIRGAGCLTLAITAPGAPAREPSMFHPLPVCRLWDTRNPPGPSGGPRLNANTTRCFPVVGLCGVPIGARGAALNLTALLATDGGSLSVFPAGTLPPPGTVLSFKTNGPPVSGTAAAGLGSVGQVCVRVDMPPGSTGTVHVTSDVYGYYTLP